MEGRVEIYYNGEWGTVCEDFWDLKDAIVVCRQLGYTTAVRRSISAEFGEGTGMIWLDNVHCSGTESMLSECNANTWGSNNCYHTRDAGVVCASKFIFNLLPNLLTCKLHSQFRQAVRAKSDREGEENYFLLVYCDHPSFGIA